MSISVNKVQVAILCLMTHFLDNNGMILGPVICLLGGHRVTSNVKMGSVYFMKTCI